MMDLTPLDVRKKKGDFRKGLRGYEAAQVDDFLDLVADRLEALVRDASTVDERIARLEQQVSDYRDREKALTEALVTAQQMREDMRTQSTREVELLRKQAEQEAEQIHADAVRRRQHEEQALEGLRSRQFQFIASYQKYLESELAELEAMVKSLRMHTGRGAAPAVPPPARAPAGPASFASVPPAPAVPASPGEAASEPSELPADDSVAEPPDAQRVSASGPAASVAARPVPTTPPASSAPAVAQDEPVDAADEEEPLEDALARWEPELGEGETASQVTPAVNGNADTDASADEDDDDLLLSAEDAVGKVGAEAADAVAEPEDEVDLAFLEFGDDDLAASEAEQAQARVDAERVEQEVDAAMVESDSTYIDLGTALGDEPDALELEDAPPADELADEAPANTAVPAALPVEPRDEMDDMIDAAFAFGDDGVVAELSNDASPEDPSVPEIVLKQQEDSEGGRDADIDFVDALLMDSSTFGEAPADASEETAATGVEPPGAERTDDAQPSEDGEDRNLIDLDSIPLSESGPPAAARRDTSSLTLHPLFFEEESAQSASDEDEAARKHQWSSSSGGG